MDKVVVVLVALYRYRNFPIRIMHPLLEKIDGVEPHTIFFKNTEANMFEPPTEKEEELFVDLITKLCPSVVGFSVLSPYVPVARRLSALVKEHCPESLVIWGGVHPTISPESCVNYVDLLCVGEGEGAITDLVTHLRDGKPYDEIQNLWVKTGTDIVKNPMRPMIDDLDSLPFPSHANDSYYFLDSDNIHKKDPLLSGHEIWIQASRGCPYKCSFCVVSLEHEIFKGLGPPVRRRSVDSVIEEIKEYRELSGPIADYVYFIDEVFGVQTTWLDKFEVDYKREVNLPFYVEYHPSSLNSERLRKLVNAGLNRLDMGIQSGSDAIRNEIFDRTGSNQEIIDLAKEIDQYGVRVNYDLIMDNPYDTHESLRNAADVMLKLPKPLWFNLFSLQYFPEYPFTKRALADGYIKPEQVTLEYLMKSTGQDWAFVPKFLPYTKQQMLQNVIWLIAANFAKGRVVKYAVFGESTGSKLCLNFLSATAVVLGKVLGVGGFVSRHQWLGMAMAACRYMLKGDFTTLRRRISTKRRGPKGIPTT